MVVLFCGKGSLNTCYSFSFQLQHSPNNLHACKETGLPAWSSLSISPFTQVQNDKVSSSQEIPHEALIHLPYAYIKSQSDGQCLQVEIPSCYFIQVGWESSKTVTGVSAFLDPTQSNVQNYIHIFPLYEYGFSVLMMVFHPHSKEIASVIL